MTGDKRPEPRPPIAVTPEKPAGPSPYESLGGMSAVEKLVEAFYRRMDALPEAAGIRAQHPADLAGTKAVLKMYFVEWLGGPGEYSRTRGHPRLRMRHAPFRIGAAERDAWLLCMRGALEEAFPAGALRDRVYARFAAIADHMRNDPGPLP